MNLMAFSTFLVREPITGRRRLQEALYCGTAEEALQKPGCDEWCPNCGWPNETGKDVWERLPAFDGLNEIPGLHVYHEEYAPYMDMPGGSGYVVIQCQRCCCFFKYDVSS